VIESADVLVLGLGPAGASAAAEAARAAKRELAFVNPPEALQTLSRLYGVETLLPLKA